MKATLKKITHITDNIYTLDFLIPDILNHSAGQYVNLILPHSNVDKRGKERWFSVSSRPGEKQFQVTTRFFGDDSSSFKRALFSLKPGDGIHVSSPMGDFVLPVDKKRQLLFVAAGIGITPYLSMLKQLEKKPDNRFIVMYYSAKKKDELLDIENYRPLLNELEYFISSEGRHLNSNLIFNKASALNDPLIYLAGPEQMIEKFRDELISLGINRPNIVGDYFDGY